jgi:RNase P protein component
MVVEPWSRERRNDIARRVREAAEAVAQELGAAHIVVVTFFPDGEHTHIVIEGNPPMPYGELYRHLQAAEQMVQERPGGGYLS